MERPAKRTKLLSDSEDSSDEVAGTKPTLNINEDFARRFEHNKQREERQRLEEKLKDDDNDSSTDESEDDEADLITDALDNEIMSTLQAIKSKDPRVYDKDAKFYQTFDENGAATARVRQQKDVPMTLKDYHRENLLSGYTGAEEEDEKMEIQTYDQEQDSLRRDVVRQMHAMAEQHSDNDDNSDSGFALKANGRHEKIAPAKARRITNTDVAEADKDPETFLSNFMAAQAWRSNEVSRPHAFDSDDSEDDARADAFEVAYNLRFEDPATANETLKSFARDTGKYSVRREDTGGRKRAREREREQKEEAKKDRDAERGRLRKLKIDDAEKKLETIKHAAGIEGKDVSVEEWRELLEGDFSDDAWDREMQRRFGDQYYSATDTATTKDKKNSKPVWNDDINIKDLVPEFDDTKQPTFVLTDDEAEEGQDETGEAADPDTKVPTKKTKKDRAREKQEAKAQHRRERRDLEDLVDATLPIATTQAGGFRYRETSPNSFGLNPRDILLASDSQLNQFAGLKKLTAFRDDERKNRDKKKLGKKARLREWRKEVFGNAEGSEQQKADRSDNTATAQIIGKKRSRKAKKPNVETNK